MDAVKILGSLLSNNAMGSNTGGSILDSLLGGGSNSGAGDILGTLLGGQKSGGSGGLGALGAILAAAAASQRGGSSGGGMDVLGSLLSGAGGGTGDLLGSLLGGGQTSAPARSGGGLGGLLGGLLGGKKAASQPSGGGAGGLLGSLLGAAGSGGGGNPLNDLLGAAASGGSANGSELLGALLGGGTPQAPPQEAQEEAEMLIQAMCYAAKADGSIDEAEKEAILGRLGDLDEDEIAYLKKHLEGSVDVDGFTSRVPDDMDEQVYAFSLMAIRLDTQAEAEYFGKLANGLGMDGDTCNRIHARLGQPEIFA